MKSSEALCLTRNHINLTYLKAENFRNLIDLEIEPSPFFNVFYGNNGSGKTSCLEAIYYLGLARSFRSRFAPRIITHEKPTLAIYGRLRSDNRLTALGIERQQSGASRIRIDGEDANTTAALAEALPLQLIDSNSHQLLIGGPQARRQFMDWGAFHVEPAFFNLWQDYHRALKQRNAAIKQGATLEQIRLWDETLSRTGSEIDKLRQHYVAEFVPVFRETWQSLMGEMEIQLRYARGWPENKNLGECLKEGAAKDLQLGYTYYGIHRADFILSANKIPIQDLLSRGQQKLLACALRLAQGKLLQLQTGKTCVYLIDDLAAELDQDKREKASAALNKLEAQVFVTGVFARDLSDMSSLPGGKMFHVEQGQVRTV